MNAQRLITYLLAGAVICVIAFVALHVVAVGGIYAFNSFKAPRRGHEPIVAAAADKRKEESAPAKTEAENMDSVYTVRRGDTPTSIARKYGLTAEELLKNNNISDARKLQIGQPLRVPFKG